MKRERKSILQTVIPSRRYGGGWQPINRLRAGFAFWLWPYLWLGALYLCAVYAFHSSGG